MPHDVRHYGCDGCKTGAHCEGWGEAFTDAGDPVPCECPCGDEPWED